MRTPISSITRAATRSPDEPLNIICCPTHERYETNLCCTGHNFYALQAPGIKYWEEKYGPVPDNYHILPPLTDPNIVWEVHHGNTIPHHIDFDLILSQNKFGQFQLLDQVRKILHLPMISLEHTLPQTRWSQLDLEHLTTMQGDLNLFISDYSRGQWLFDESNSQIIHHGVDTETFSPADVPQEPIILSVVNDWVNRDWCCGFRYWQQATAGLPVKPVGNTPGLSEAASSMDELVHFYRTSQVFVNTSLISPIPTALLEAMSCGAAVVTTNNCMIPEIVKHGYNGYLANSPQEMKTYLVDLLNDADKRKTFGINARRTITENFSLESFVDTWNKYLRTTSEIVFV